MGIITVIGGFLQYVSLYAKGDLLKNLYDESDINWDSLTDVTEIAIFTKFVHRGRLLSYFHMGKFSCFSMRHKLLYNILISIF